MFDAGKNESDNQKRKHLEKFASSTKGKITGLHGKIQQKNQERIAKNESDFKEINIRINNIINSDDQNNMKIQELQRLLNEKSKKMDKPMLQTVKNELTKLHKIEGTSENENDGDQSAMMQQRQTARPYNGNENDNEIDNENDNDYKSPSEVFSQGL